MAGAENSQYHEIDLPELVIPEELVHMNSSDSELVTEFLSAPSTPRTPGTPQTPGTPVSLLGAGFSAFDFSDTDESPSSPVTTPKMRKKRYPQRFPSKHYGLFRTPSKIKPKRPRVSTSTSGSKLLEGCHFPESNKAYDVLLNDGGNVSTRSLLVPKGSEIMNMDILSNVFNLIPCRDHNCSGSLKLHKYPLREGLQTYLVLHCDRCHSIVAKFPTTQHLGESAKEAVNNPKMMSHRSNEINVRATLALHTTSFSWQDFRLACALLDLPVPQKNLNKRSMGQLIEVTSKVSAIAMDLAAEEVRCRVDSEPSVINGVTRCHVSYDASWHRRGHYSNQGFGAAIDSHSGKVLDYGLMQRVCKKCCNWSDERKVAFPEEYESFLEHHSNCTINFTGTSQAMEGAIAVDLWKRSVTRNNLVYSTYIGDGDSSSFKRVLESDPYEGLEPIRKEECLGHLQKRVKKHLTKKTSTSASIPKAKAERIGQLYALVVVQNKGKQPEVIRQALWTLVGHLGEEHANCPITCESWCYFARAEAEFALDYSVTLPKRRIPYCTDTEIIRITQVFQTFASLEVCGALTMGKTQNANDSLHSVIWHNSPKGKYIGQKSLDCSTALAVTSFNEGSLSFAAILREYGVSVFASTVHHLASRDKTRILKREKAILETQRRRRHQQKVRSKAAEASRQRREKKASKYIPGAFGTEILPTQSAPDPESGEESDSPCATCDSRICPIGRRRKVDEWIGCDLCDRWHHGRCVGMKKVAAYTDVPFFCPDCQESS